jgi:hypothetical protein
MKDVELTERRLAEQRIKDRRLYNNMVKQAPFKASERILWAMRFIDAGKYEIAKHTLERDVLPILQKLEREGKL